MAAVDVNALWDKITTTTLAKYAPTFEDNVFSETPLLDFLVKKSENASGQKIVEQITYAANDTAGSYGEWDPLFGAGEGWDGGTAGPDAADQDTFTAAQFPWKYAKVVISASGADKVKNTGKEQIIDLLKAKIMVAEESLSTVFEDMFFASEPAAATDFNGIGFIVNDTTNAGIAVPDASSNIVGDIDGDTQAWWNSVVVDAGATVRDTAEWNNAYLSAGRGMTKRPDFAITTQALYEHYEADQVPQLRYTSGDKTADESFESLAFKGLRLYYSDNCPTGETYFLNSNNIKLRKSGLEWFTATPWTTDGRYNGSWSAILCSGNLTTNNRGRLARVTDQAVA